MASPPGAVGMPVVETIATIRRALPCCAARLRGGTKRMIAFNGPTQRSPTLNDAINARRWLRTLRSAAGRAQATDMPARDFPPEWCEEIWPSSIADYAEICLLERRVWALFI